MRYDHLTSAKRQRPQSHANSRSPLLRFSNRTLYSPCSQRSRRGCQRFLIPHRSDSDPVPNAAPAIPEHVPEPNKSRGEIDSRDGGRPNLIVTITPTDRRSGRGEHSRSIRTTLLTVYFISTRLSGNVPNSHDFSGDILGRKNKIYAPGCDRAFGHVCLPGGLGLLRDSDASHFFYSA
jgi:hypothetical protein